MTAANDEITRAISAAYRAGGQINGPALARAREVVDALADLALPPLFAVVMRDGGIQLEWDRGGCHVEVEVPPVGSLDVYFVIRRADGGATSTPVLGVVKEGELSGTDVAGLRRVLARVFA